MRDFLLYLAGPISGTSYDESTDWRKYVSSRLPRNIIGVSPLRGETYLENEEVLMDSYEHFPISCRKGITSRARMEVIRADMVLVNFVGAKKVSIGSVMEIAWADILRKPVVVAMEKDSIHWHAIVREVSDYIVSDIDEAIDIAIKVLLPNH